MEKEKYLKPQQYYSDLYDRHTVEECRRLENTQHDLSKYPDSEISEEGKKTMLKIADDLALYFAKGERYANKKATIRKWMDRDQAHDNFYESAKAPKDITCFTCGKLMFVTSSHLNPGFDNETDRVLFFYDCPVKHLPRRAFYDNGEEYKVNRPVCSKCKSSVEENHKKERDKITITYICENCKHSETEVMDFSPKEEKVDPDFAKDRDRFCLSEKEGQEYMEAKYSLEEGANLLDEIKEREKNKELYEKVSKLKKLKIIDVEQLLTPLLEAEKYIKLQFESPSINKDIIVSFSVHDAKENREEHVSTRDLEKLIKKSLQGTNWKLMSDGTHYRLGLLTGRLRGFERENDMLELVATKKSKL